MERNKIIKTASIISIIGNSVLAISKIVVGIIAGSLSVLADGFDSLIDIFISLITLVASVIIAFPPDKKHPYGHFRAETIATFILAFIIFFIGGQLVLSSVQSLYRHDIFQLPKIEAIYITIISIAGKLLLSYSQVVLGKKSESSMLMANAKNMQNDIITSIGVLVGLGFGFYFNLPIIDKILAIFIGIWIMYSAVKIFLGTITELMEGEDNQDLYEKIFTIIKNIEGVSNPHRVRLKKLGIYFFVDLDIEVDGNRTVNEAHNIAKIVEEKIRTSIPNIYDIVVHVEPLGNIEKDERYGLKEHDIKKYKNNDI